jgi:hypothetical protein
MTLPERRLHALCSDVTARIDALFDGSEARSYPATVAVVVRLPDGNRLVGADTEEAAREVASGYAPDPGPPPSSEPRRWAIVVAARTCSGWIDLARVKELALS